MLKLNRYDVLNSTMDAFRNAGYVVHYYPQLDKVSISGKPRVSILEGIKEMQRVLLGHDKPPRRRMGIGKKPTVYTDECVQWLMGLSKAALADCVVDLLRGVSDWCDEPVSKEAAIERLAPVLRMRSDKLPK